jgi:hypothetical protein
VALVVSGLSLIALYLALLGFIMLWTRGARGGKASAQTVVLVVLPLLPVMMGLSSYMTLPPLHDVSSDLVDPPQWIERVDASQSWLGRRRPATALDREAQMIAYRDISGRRYEGALDRVYTAALKVARETGIDVTDERGAPGAALLEVPPTGAKNANEAVPDALDNIPIPLPRPDNEPVEGAQMPPGDALIQGVHRTLVFGFRQDVVIRLREEAETTLVDIRVETRYGHHDLGSGAAFIEKYLRALDAELLGIAGG